MNKDSFLRSINIEFDADAADRIAHYFPTEKSASLLRRLLSFESERAFFVVAPYGSGKSLVGAYSLHTLENRKESRSVLKELNSRMAGVDAQLHEWHNDRIRCHSRHGLVIPMHGFAEDLVRQLILSALGSFARLGLEKKTKVIAELLKLEAIDIVEALQTIKECASQCKIDSVLILWDEFGRHLETLIAEGRSAELSELQTLAEFVSRQQKTPFSLALFLHQGLLDYASNLPQVVRREWRKVEGRFATVNYVEDSKEIYRLIGEIVSAQSHIPKPKKVFFTDVARRHLKVGRFSGFKQRELAGLLERAYPLTPAALELLPRISARVSQNERTLFTFLFNLELDEASEPIHSATLFDYFSDQMQADADLGGTQRQWLETQSALSKVAGDPGEEGALKAICLLSLGLSGERTRATKAQVALALSGYEEEVRANAVIDDLLKRKLLLHRKHSDEVSIWHGADLDLRGRLNDAKRDLEAGFDLVKFLDKEALPPIWKPQHYNDAYSISRYYRSEFVTIDELVETGSFSQRIRADLGATGSADGCIYYLLINSQDDAVRAEELISDICRQDSSGEEHPRTLFILPTEPLSIQDAALEVACLLEMEQDKELIDQDPLLLPELQQMLEDARSHLQQLVDRLTLPDRSGLVVFYKKNRYEISSARLLQLFLSNVTKLVFGLTPKLRNELIVRKKVPANVVNSRKKLVLGVLERGGEELFGIVGNFPDASMARTLLVDTGLYYRGERSKLWTYAKPEQVNDPGLRAVWAIVEDFFTTPSEEGKSPEVLFETLSRPPYGLRAALFPILFAAGLKAFAYSTSLLEDGEYVSDVLPSQIESLCKTPSRYTLRVFRLDSAQSQYLESLFGLFSKYEQADSQDLIRNCYDAIQMWLQALPPGASTTRRLPDEVIQFRAKLNRQKDPVALLLVDIPKLFGLSISNPSDLDLSKLQEAKSHLDSIVEQNRKLAVKGLMSAIEASDRANLSARQVASQWAASFFDVLPKDHAARPMLMRMRLNYKSDSAMIDSVAAEVSRVSIPRWEDEDVDAFEGLVKRLVNDVEKAVLSGDLSGISDQEIAKSLSALLSGRIANYLEKLESMGQKDTVRVFLEDFLESTKKTTNK